ncbi:Berberine bridge enzyme-like 8 [Linum grandiflorum]
MQCLLNNSNPSNPISEAIYTPNDTASYSSVLQSYIQNQRFNFNNATSTSSSKPFLILTALHVSHVQTAVVCASTHGVQMKIRSGGHDYEGLSYVSLTQQPFFILDMFNLRSVDVDIPSETAWIQTGAILGEVYYRIAEKSNVHGFPAGICPTVGVGGHVSGGGYGNMLRQHGLTVDNVVDAMLNVTVFSVFKTVEQEESATTDIVDKWQHVADKLDERLFIRLVLNVVNATKVRARFLGFFLGDSAQLLSVMKEYLGRVKELIPLLNESFPELGFKEEDGKEMSWLDSVLFWVPFPEGTPAEALLSRNSSSTHNKMMSDYLTEVIPKESLAGIWAAQLTVGPSFTKWNPYGGRMAEIPADETAYGHRAGYLFKVQYYVGWAEEEEEEMTPFVTKEPREAFFNYRDLDNGENSIDKPDWKRAKVYGEKYFKGHFERLSKIKRQFDPDNFFRDQQSIPPFPY